MSRTLRAAPPNDAARRARALRGQADHGHDPRLLVYALGYDVLCESSATGGDFRPLDERSGFAGLVVYAWNGDPARRAWPLLRGLAKALLTSAKGSEHHVPELAEALAALA